MARWDSIDETELRHLARVRPQPMVSILLPTHRYGPELDQDRIRLGQLVNDLRSHPDIDLLTSHGVVHHLDEELSAIEWEHVDAGLIVYADDQGAHHHRIGVAVTPRINVAHRAVLGPLLLHRQLTRPLVILSFTPQGASISDHHLYRHGEGPPNGARTLTVTFDEHDRVAPHRFAQRPDVIRRTRQRQMVTAVDEGLGTFMDGMTPRIFLASSPRLRSTFLTHSRFSHLVDKTDLGNFGRPEITDLGPVQHLIERSLRHDIDRSCQEQIDVARGQRRLITGLDEMALIAAEGTGAVLMVRHDLEGSADPDLRDRLDIVIADVIVAGGSVIFPSAEVLAEDGDAVLISRF